MCQRELLSPPGIPAWIATAGAVVAPLMVGCWIPLCTDFFFQHPFFLGFCLNTSVPTVWKYINVYVTYKKICSILRTDVLGVAYHHIPVFKGWLQRGWRFIYCKESDGKDKG